MGRLFKSSTDIGTKGYPVRDSELFPDAAVDIVMASTLQKCAYVLAAQS